MLPLKIENLAVSFPGLAAPVLVIDHLEIVAGSRVALTGGSGSGKSTLINIIAGLERVETGRVVWGNGNIAELSEGRRDHWRAANIGLVMQEFHLFPGLSALDNILLPARLSRVANAELINRAESLFATVGLKRPGQHIETMSRGEMQRVAIARALLRSPGVIIADEPTASLDLESGEAVGDLLLAVAAGTG
ncbi:MAG: ATP-binding cassette domain-containing protein, partial [Agrobacterium sp.]|nr:ATP-binding cassette domain-containing protein [Agrobacterium sp.]